MAKSLCYIFDIAQVISVALSYLFLCCRYFGNVLLKSSPFFQFQNDGTSYTLTVRDAELQHAGTYTVKAVNQTGEVSSAAVLNVNGNRQQFSSLARLR